MGPATSSGDSRKSSLRFPSVVGPLIYTDELRSITLGFETGSGTPGNSGTTTVEQKVTFYHWGQGKPDKEMYYKLLEKYNASRDAVGLCQCEHTYATCTHGPVDPGKIPGEPSIPIQQWQPLRQCNNTVSATDLIPPSRLCQSVSLRASTTTDRIDQGSVRHVNIRVYSTSCSHVYV